MDINATEQGTYNYTYDALYRLTDVQVDIPGQENEGFSYDAVGNRLSEQGVEGEWTYNANNELLTVATTEYTYDANGNARHLLLDGTVMFTYHYNAWDRMVKVDDVNGNTIAEYYYDPFGRRLWKDVGSTRTYFFYADEGLVAEYDSSGTEIRAYGYRPDSTWTTDPLWLKQGDEYYFYQNDHLGTPQKLVKQNGAIAWSASYIAFGKASVEVEAVTNNLRFPGQYFDAEFDRHYNYFRYYDPETGRYLRIDPLGFNGGSMNVYTYVLNNPMNGRDVNGRQLSDLLDKAKQAKKENRPTMPDFDFCECMKWMEQYKDTTWTETLPACPCELPDTSSPGTEWVMPRNPGGFHPGATTCVRSRPKGQKMGQQCCYDTQGKLITHGSGAGTPDRASSVEGYIVEHQLEDVAPWFLCGGWLIYNRVHPPNNGLNCEPNLVVVISW